MRSMTGFGAARHAAAIGEAAVQLSAVNGKGCQVQVRGDLRDLALEDEVRRRVRDAAVRGTVTVQVRLTPAAGTGLDRTRLAAAWRELAALATELGAPPPALERVAQLAAAPADAGDRWRPPVLAALDAALAAFATARAQEGAALHAALHGHRAALLALRPRLAEVAARRVPAWRDRLVARLRDLLAAAVSDDALLREAALHAERCDIAEELARLDAHLAALGALLDRDGEQGRELDFLLQEIGREINTTGAKANDAELSALIVAAKVAVDQAREQAANVL